MALDRMNNFIENEVQTEAEMPAKQNEECWENHVDEDVSSVAQQSSHCGQKVDSSSRILFPLGFLVFNLTYWYTYLYKSKK